MKTLKRFLSVLLLFAVFMSLCACGALKTETEKTEKAEKFENSFFEAFDATITLTAYCESQEQFEACFTLVKDEFIRCHRLFDIYFSYSGLNNLKTVNDNAGQSPVKVDGDIITLLEFGKELYSLSDGRVNIAFGSVLSIWHDIRDFNNIQGTEKKLPDMSELQLAAKHCNIDDIIIDKAAGTVYLSDGQMRLDVGAVAKGYATEKAAVLLEASGCKHACINAGGNVRTVGLKPDGEKWSIAVTNPDITSSQSYVGVAEVGSASVVTSGVYQRFFEFEGRRYHHIIDTKTLMPENRCLSVTVVTEDSAYADGLSTALFNMDVQQALSFAETLDDVEALWVLPDGAVVKSSGFPDK